MAGRSIGFFFALDKDWQTFQEELGATPSARKLGSSSVFEIGTPDAKVFAIKMGSGAVTTAISTQSLISIHRLDMAFSVGPVGTLSSKFKVGEWCRVSRVVPWQTGKATAGGEANVAEGSFDEIPSDYLGKYADLSASSVASGEQFVSSGDVREEIASRTGCDAVDMNLFGLVEVLRRAAIPSFHLRVFSDAADENAPGQFRDFIRNYHGEGGRMIAGIIRSLPPDRTSPKTFPGLRNILEKTPAGH